MRGAPISIQDGIYEMSLIRGRLRINGPLQLIHYGSLEGALKRVHQPLHQTIRLRVVRCGSVMVDLQQLGQLLHNLIVKARPIIGTRRFRNPIPATKIMVNKFCNRNSINRPGGHCLWLTGQPFNSHDHKGVASIRISGKMSNTIN